MSLDVSTIDGSGLASIAESGTSERGRKSFNLSVEAFDSLIRLTQEVNARRDPRSRLSPEDVLNLLLVKLDEEPPAPAVSAEPAVGSGKRRRGRSGEEK